jgi:hypothetical protein
MAFDDFLKLVWSNDWGEIMGLIAIFMGVFLAFSSDSASITYVGALIVGILFGMRWFSVRKGPRMGWYIIITGFLIGYSIGSLFYASFKLIVITFIAGLVVGFIIKKSMVPAKRR